MAEELKAVGSEKFRSPPASLLSRATSVLFSFMKHCHMEEHSFNGKHCLYFAF